VVYFLLGHHVHVYIQGVPPKMTPYAEIDQNIIMRVQDWRTLEHSV